MIASIGLKGIEGDRVQVEVQLLPGVEGVGFIILNEEQRKIVQQWESEYNCSTRVQMKILRLARTIADLSGSAHITSESIWEAASMRRSGSRIPKKGKVQ
ncbi:hypothetical protein [Radiobacillus sp. PE A8.2]|uniref:magnesium chelatase subunit ChlI family protein n=1 Tax=Radiobacillus sp. PE A8.2 TaxID=3380349 RepID=UPI003890033A